jgi:DNA-binding GntR family transcriptional regulator
MDERIKQKSLPEHIADDLERKILAGTLKPGQRMIEEALCRAFGVSRSPVREAFQVLESQGFVVREPRKGVSVAKVTPQEAADIYQIRASLEGLATALAVQRRTPALMTQLKQAHQELRRAAGQDNLRAYQRLNRRFHELVIGGCGNPRLIQLIRAFDKQTLRYRLAVRSAPGWMANSMRLHALTMASFEAGDAEKAERIRKEAILSQIDRFPDLFKTAEER